MSPRTLFIGDTHFGHKNIINWSDDRKKYSDIQEHDEGLVDIWNSVVRPKDNVFHLGDVAFGKHNLKWVKQLNGNKKLILGNHDTYPVEDYIDAGFNKVFGIVNYKEFILSHAPLHTTQLEYRWKYNIHGHIHKPEEYDLDVRYINVNADAIGLTPVTLEEIRGIVHSRECGV